MMAFYKHASRALLLGCVCLSLLEILVGQNRDVDVAVVVHPDTPVGNLGLTEVRKVFLGDRQYWSTNIPVVLLIRAPVARERNVVLKIIYQMSVAVQAVLDCQNLSCGIGLCSQGRLLERHGE